MLKAEVSRRRKAFTLLNDLVWFAVGAAWVFSDTESPSLTDIRGPLGKSPVELILGIGLMTTYAISLVHDWYFGGVLKRYRANSRTLAILCPGHPTVYVKRAEVVAAAHGGGTLVLADGSRHRISTQENNAENQFLVPLYDLWWPACPLHRVRRTLGEKGPTFAHFFFLILCAWAPFIPHLFLDSATHTWLFPATVSVFVVVLVLLFAMVFRSIAEARANLFHFDGPDAQENWDLMGRGQHDA